MSTLLSTQNSLFHNNHGILLSNISFGSLKVRKLFNWLQRLWKKYTIKTFITPINTNRWPLLLSPIQVIMAYVEQQLPSELQSICLIDAVLHKLPEELRAYLKVGSELLLN